MIELAQTDGIWTVTLNRPHKANSLTRDMLEALVDIAQRAQTARALILTGHGNVFSAGADLEEARTGLAVSDVWERLSNAIAQLPCLTIAALNGTVAGGATGMVLACDLRLSTPEAKFFYPVMKLGFLPQPSDVMRLKALIGPARTKLILMGGQKLTADEALRFGLIDRITGHEDVMQTALNWAADSVNADTKIVQTIKEMCT